MKSNSMRCVTVAASLFLVSSCATPLRYAKPLDPIAALSPEAVFFLKADRAVLEAAGGMFMEEADAKTASPILRRTESVSAALWRDGNGAIVFEAIALGSYPSGAVQAGLSLDGGWAREGSGFVNKATGLRIAFADNYVAVAANVSLGPIASRLLDPNDTTMPPEGSAAWNSDIAIFVPRAATVLSSLLGLETDGIPLQAILVSGISTGDAYDCRADFLFLDERSAKVFAPLCKLLLYAALRASDIPIATGWTWNGRTLSASPLRLDASSFARLGAAVIAPQN